MPRYYFHIERDGGKIVDEEGSSHADLQSVQAIALKSAADIAAEDLARGSTRLEQFVTVVDERGDEVVRVRVEATVDVQSGATTEQRTR